ncbi:hypothetical protein N2152v2_007035 [Parachlorella kessleri]
MHLHPLLLLLLALAASAQLEGFSIITIPAEDGYQGVGTVVGPRGPAYGIKCQLQGAPECPEFTNDRIHFDYSPEGTLGFSYFPPYSGGQFTFSLCVDQDAATCSSPVSAVDIIIVPLLCSCADPVISGFDGTSFHFNEVGEYVMLEAADGYKVYSTFAGATAYNGAKELMERSWTSSVRVVSPNGDMVSCALPAIVPNTSRIQVTAATSSGTTMLSTTKPNLELAHMSASAVLSEGEEPRTVTGCMLITPKLDIRVDQISGYRQAQLHPDTESWAAPFTWLDTTMSVKKPLPGPVTGVIGATYPADQVARQYLLDFEKSGQAAPGVTAEMVGEAPGRSVHRRSLSSTPPHFMPITSGITGLATVARSAAAA